VPFPISFKREFFRSLSGHDLIRIIPVPPPGKFTQH
jgi:hypothetical protein